MFGLAHVTLVVSGGKTLGHKELQYTGRPTCRVWDRSACSPSENKQRVMRSSCFASCLPSPSRRRHHHPKYAGRGLEASARVMAVAQPLAANGHAPRRARERHEYDRADLPASQVQQRIERLGVPAYGWHMEAAHGAATGGVVSVFPCSRGRLRSIRRWRCSWRARQRSRRAQNGMSTGGTTVTRRPTQRRASPCRPTPRR